jgi:hypothetical protein
MPSVLSVGVARQNNQVNWSTRSQENILTRIEMNQHRPAETSTWRLVKLTHLLTAEKGEPISFRKGHFLES